jgi:hypothetical protein
MFRIDPESKKTQLTLEHSENPSIFISSEDVSHKTVHVVNYCKEYHRLHPENKIYVISNSIHNDIYKSFNQITMLDLCTEDKLDEIKKYSCHELLHNSLVIFDNIITIKNNKIKNALVDLLRKCSHGYYNTHLIYCGIIESHCLEICY